MHDARGSRSCLAVENSRLDPQFHCTFPAGSVPKDDRKDTVARNSGSVTRFSPGTGSVGRRIHPARDRTTWTRGEGLAGRGREFSSVLGNRWNNDRRLDEPVSLAGSCIRGRTRPRLPTEMFEKDVGYGVQRALLVDDSWDLFQSERAFGLSLSNPFFEYVSFSQCPMIRQRSREPKECGFVSLDSGRNCHLTGAPSRLGQMT